MRARTHTPHTHTHTHIYGGYIAISQIYTVAWMPATSSSHRVGSRNSNCRIERTFIFRIIKYA